jgi:hypothetical protein
MIKIYPSKLEGEPLEEHPVEAVTTFDAWMTATVKGYTWSESPPISAHLNGRLLTPDEWKTESFGRDDTVCVYPEPKLAGTFLGISYGAWALAAAAVVLAIVLQPSIPKAGKTADGRGRNIDEAAAKGNKVKLNSPIEEVAGQRRKFPSYLVPLHRYFESERQLAIKTHLCFGKGEFDIPPSQILIGDTPILSLGADVTYQVYQPGEVITGDDRCEWWHSATEVGATSAGTSGIELTVVNEATSAAAASSYLFTGSSVSVPAGAGELPSDWQAGMLVRIESPRAYTVTDGGAGRDIIGGSLSELAPSPGMEIEVVGDNEGFYSVETFTAGVAGAASTITGNAAPSRYDFHVTPATFTLNRSGQSWVVNLTTNAVNLAGLVSAVNAQLGSAPLIASSSGGFLRVSEVTPFSGQVLNRTISADATTVFGAAPVLVTGTATTDDRMTLNYEGGAPANGLQTGAAIMGFGYAGMLYRILTASTSAITVERLTDTGATDGAWPGFTTFSTSQASLILDSSTDEGGWIGPFAACPDGEVTDRIEWDVFFPAGLIRIGSKGQKKEWTVSTELQYRDATTAGAWTSVSNSYSGETYDQIGYTEGLTLPSTMRPEVRMRRIGAKATIQGIQEIIQWYGLRADLTHNLPASYAGATTIALRVASGAKLAAQSEQLVSALITRKLPVRVGGVWQPLEATRDIAPWVAYVAKSLGYTDDDIDLAELDRLDGVWQARGDTYDNEVAQRSTAKESINNALRAGMAEYTVDRGLIRPVRDEPRAFFDHMYTPQNMTGPLKRQFQSFTPDDFDGLDVEYTSSRTWQVETVECRLPGDAGTRVEKISLEGVTDRTQAWQIGMRVRRASVYRRFIYNFDTELDALNSRYMSYAALGDDVPGYNKSALLLSFAPMGGAVLLQSSEPFDWTDPGAHMVAIRKKDGSLSGPYVATRIDDYRLTVPSPLDFTPDTTREVEPPHLLFGPVDRWTYPALITEVNPSGRTGCSVVAVNYDARVYEDDDNSPPA